MMAEPEVAAIHPMMHISVAVLAYVYTLWPFVVSSCVFLPKRDRISNVYEDESVHKFES